MAAKPVGNSAARGDPLPRRERALELGVDRARPDDRAGPSREPVPQRSSASCAAATHRGCCGQAEVVVRRERHDRAAVGERAFGPVRVEVARRAPAPGGADRVAFAVGPVAPRHGAVTSSIASASASTMRWSSARGDRERRHQHDDVAERPQQHAALDRRRATRAGPSAARRAAARARRRPSGPASRTSRTAGFDATRSCEQRRAARRIARARWRARPTRRSARGGAARPRRRARSRRRSGRGTACAARGRRRGTASNTRPLATVADIGEVAAGDALAEAQQVGARARTARDANSVPVRPKPVATSSQISSTSCARHAAPSAREAARGRRAACRPRPARAARRRPRRARTRGRSTIAAAIVEAVGRRRTPARAAPGSAADRRCRCRSRRRRATARRSCRRGTRRRTRGTSSGASPRLIQYWNAIFSACSTAAAPSDA